MKKYLFKISILVRTVRIWHLSHDSLLPFSSWFSVVEASLQAGAAKTQIPLP